MMAHQSAFGEYLPEIGTSSMHGLEIQAAGMDLLGIPSGRHQNGAAYPMRGLLSQDFLDGAEAMVDQASAAQLTESLSLSLSKIEQSGAIIGASHGALDLNATNPRHMQQQQQQLFMAQEGMRFHSLPFQLRYSKYLIPAQELLNEFCSLGEEEMENGTKKRLNNKTTQLEDGWTQSLSSMDLPQLQKIKAKLLYMLEEVDKRYRRYCEQMRTVRESFEAMSGEGAARVYSSLASKAMSKHFRCLRDAIAARARAVKKVIGEKDPALASASGAGSTSKAGETPRLKLLDQYIRRQKAFQQGMMEHHPWRPQRGLPEHAVSVLRSWLFEHFLHPYPSDMDKHILARQAGLSRSQVSNWFINARVRLWKPMVEEMYTEELKEIEGDGNTSSQAAGGRDQDCSNPNPNPSVDQKPSQVQLLSNDVSDSLSSVINSGTHQEHQQQRMQTSRGDQGLGVMSNLDFSYGDYGSQQGGTRNGVSLTLGLQQHSGDPSTSLAAFASSAPKSHSSFDLLHRSGRVEDAEVQFALLDWETQNLIPYRNMMLHDLAGNAIR